MTYYLDDTGLERFFDNVKNLMHGPSYQQVVSYLNAHPESLNDPVADYLDENPTATIPNGSITADKLASNSVTSEKIADGAVTTNDLANGAVTSAKIADGTITTSDLADGSVTTAKIANSAITTTKIADEAVTANKLANDAIPTMSTTTPGIAKVGAGLAMNNGAIELDADTTGISGAVDAWLDAHPEATTTVVDGSITTAKLADDAVTDAKLAQVGGVLSTTEYLRRLVTGIESWGTYFDKYATYAGSGVVSMYDVTDAGCVKIDVSAYVGNLILISSETLSTTYNVLYLFADADDIRISSARTSGVTDYHNVTAVVPAGAKWMYVNFDGTNGVTRAYVQRVEVGAGVILCDYPIVTVDTLAKTVTIDNGVKNANALVYLRYGDKSAAIADSNTHLSQTFSNVNNGVLVYDVQDTTFKVLETYNVKELTRYVTIAVLYGGEVMDATSPIITLANDNKHAKKTMVCYGDSLTWYDGNEATWGPDEGTTIMGFESYLRSYMHMNVINAGRSGQTLPQICARMASDNAARNCDMLMLMGGDNDDRLDVSVGTLLPQGSTFDTTTTIGAMQNAIEAVLTDNPEVMIFLVTEPMGWKWNGSFLERVDDAYPNAIRRVAEYYGLPLLDLWKISGVNEMTRNTMYLDPPDTTNQQYMYHPSNYGWKVISERIIQFIQTL